MILKRFENLKFSCEYKYDGLRGQVHYYNGKCDIYSRNLGKLTETYPDICDYIIKNTKEGTENFILDSEIVAVNTQTVIIYNE